MVVHVGFIELVRIWLTMGNFCFDQVLMVHARSMSGLGFSAARMSTLK